MAAGDSVNQTHVDNTYPCYVIDLVTYKIINTHSIFCILLNIFLSSIATVTVIGNLLVIISIIYFKQLHTPTNSLILSLAFTDLLVGFLVFPFSLQFPADMCISYRDVPCQIRDGVEVTLSTASVLNLCCISIDRYYAVCQPLTYRTKINAHVAVIMIVVTWVVSVLVAVGNVVTMLNLEKCQKNCYFAILLANTVGFLLSFYLPVIVIVCIYLKIFLVAQRQARSIQNTKTTTTTRKVEGKATRTLGIVLGFFLLCWMPLFLFLASMLWGSVSFHADLYYTFSWLAIFNSVVDPFIYAIFFRWYRSAFRLILTGKIFQRNCSNTKLL